MRVKYRPHHIFEVVLLFIALAGFSASNSKANENSKYLDAVREFADNVLKYGRDTYGPKHTPLFVDGLNIHTHEPVKWIAPNGDRWILSNLASQQNLFRTLDGLTKITGDPKYRQAAVEAIEYAFDNLRSPNGLLYWGNATAYDVQGEKAFGWRIGSYYVHVLKAHFPYYELMWQVDPEATKTFIESFWSAHVRNWSNLAMDRIGQYHGELDQAWKHKYEGGPVFFESDSGTSFFNAGSDLVCAAASLVKLSGDKEPLIWAKRLAHRYVQTRHPKTGISYGMYTKSKWVAHESYDDIMRKLVPGTVDFPTMDFPWAQYTNPIFRESTHGQFMPTPGILVHKPVFYWQSQFLVGEILGGEGCEFKQWALEELTAYGKANYRRKDNAYVPILTDGTNLEGYVVRVDGPLGPKGVTLEPLPVRPSDYWAYTMAYRVTKDEFMWKMAHSIAKGNEFGDIGATAKDKPKLNLGTDCSDPYAVLAFLELHRATGKSGFLKIAKKIGNNILGARFHKGFFLASDRHIITKFDAIDSLVLLHLHSTPVGDTAAIPQVWPSLPYLVCPYRSKDLAVDNTILYMLTESSNPPISLNEAAAMGRLDIVESLIAMGADVNNKEDGFFKTPLHRAALSGHKDVAGLLLAKGADIDARDHFNASSLHYAAEKGHTSIAELLIAGGANINAKERQGHTPLDLAMNKGRKEIAKLLLSKGADGSLHAAACIGDLQRVEKFIDDGMDVDAKDQKGQTALHYAAKAGDDIAIAEFLIAHGADVNAGGEWTPLQEAAYYSKEIVELLLAKGANINTGKWTALHSALDAERFDIVELLLAKGADVNIGDGKGRTPLHIAAWYAASNNPKIVELLLSKGADINAKDNNDKTALSYAMENGHTSIAELLRKHGAKE